MMNKKIPNVLFPVVCFIACVFVMAIPPAPAQEAEQPLICAGIYDAIVTLNEPRFDTPAIWRALEGDEYGFDQFRDATIGPDDILVGAGVTSTQDNQALSPYLMAFSLDGQTAWQARQDTSDIRSFENIVHLDEGYFAAGNIEDETTRYNGIYIAKFSETGQQLLDNTFFNKTYHYTATGLAVSPDGEGVSVLGWAKNPKDVTDRHSFLLQLDKDGKLIRKRNYQPGPNNKLVSLSTLADGTFIATGWIMQESGRKAGWVVRMGDTGYLMWQRSYRRGKDAVLYNATSHPGDGFVVVGESDPYEAVTDNDNKGGWAMHITSMGEPVWQRFWRGRYDLSGRDVTVFNSNQIQALVQASTVDAGKRSHAKILSLTLRGQLIEEEAFMEGGNTIALRLLKASGNRRALAGYAQTVFSIAGGESQTDTDIFDAWLLLANAPEPFTDPCSPDADNGQNRPL